MVKTKFKSEVQKNKALTNLNKLFQPLLEDEILISLPSIFARRITNTTGKAWLGTHLNQHQVNDPKFYIKSDEWFNAYWHATEQEYGIARITEEETSETNAIGFNCVVRQDKREIMLQVLKKLSIKSLPLDREVLMLRGVYYSPFALFVQNHEPSTINELAKLSDRDIANLVQEIRSMNQRPIDSLLVNSKKTAPVVALRTAQIAKTFKEKEKILPKKDMPIHAKSQEITPLLSFQSSTMDIKKQSLLEYINKQLIRIPESTDPESKYQKFQQLHNCIEDNKNDIDESILKAKHISSIHRDIGIKYWLKFNFFRSPIALKEFKNFFDNHHNPILKK